MELFKGNMDREKINKIRSLIDSLAVVNRDEQRLDIDTSFLEVKIGNYRLNNGEVIRRESVVKRYGCADTVAVFAIDKSGDILLVIQPRVLLPTNSSVDIEIPAGYIENDENIIEAAKRELKEETGYYSDNVVLLDNYYSSLGYSGEKMYITLALDCEKIGTQELDSDEYIHFIKVSIDEFKYLVENEYIVDAASKFAYYKMFEYLSNNNMLDRVR